MRRLYDWVLGWAHTPYGAPMLFLLSLAESSFFPIPPDVLLMALSISIPKKALKYALYCSVGSVIGGIVGYFIGAVGYEAIGRHIIEFYGATEKFNYVASKYKENAFAFIVIAGFTPIPYKVFTIAAGVFDIRLSTLVLASAISRSARFFILAVLIHIFGPSIKSFIDKYFNILSVAFVVLLILGFIVIRLIVK